MPISICFGTMKEQGPIASLATGVPVFLKPNISNISSLLLYIDSG